MNQRLSLALSPGIKRNFSYQELYELVSRLRQAMIKTGVKPGDRVAALLPNIPESVACMLAATSLGALWSSCSPDFRIIGILDRFSQIKPKLLIGLICTSIMVMNLIAVKKSHKISSELGSVKKTIIVPFDPENTIYHKSNLAGYLEPFKPEPITFESFSFNHPLYVLFQVEPQEYQNA